MIAPAAGAPLSVLLSQALMSLTRDLQPTEAGAGPVPSLTVWSALLRLADAEKGVDLRELPAQARLSRRAVRAIVGDAQRRGWITIESDSAERGAKRVRLTENGWRARRAWERCLADADGRWRAQYGAAEIEALRLALEDLVRRLPLDLPHYPLGYGPADPSITGGGGRDWASVPRGAADTVRDIPLPALLSQALVAFTMEYEQEAGVALPLSANILRFLGGDGLSRGDLVAASPYVGRTIFLGTLERHGYLVIAPDPSGSRHPWVRLTPRGRQAHDRYAPLLAEIERRWEAQYGAPPMQALRSSLEALADHFPPDLPHHPG